MISRRTFLSTAALAARQSTADHLPLKIGITDWNLHLGANPEAVTAAARLGFAAVQISFGRVLVNGRLPADRDDIIGQYRRLSMEHAIPIDGTCVDRLHDNGLKSDMLAPKWVLDSIRLTHQLGVRVLLLPFFGRWKIINSSERDYVADALRDLAAEAGRAGVILGLENTISAGNNARILDRVRSPHVAVYYDVGNATQAGFDIIREIHSLGKERICQFHLKDNPHLLGEGSIDFLAVLKAIRDIGWTGFANLETDVPTATQDADLRRNLAYIQKLESKTYA